jgi:hypothetical protein
MKAGEKVLCKQNILSTGLYGITEPFYRKGRWYKISYIEDDEYIFIPYSDISLFSYNCFHMKPYLSRKYKFEYIDNEPHMFNDYFDTEQQIRQQKLEKISTISL